MCTNVKVLGIESFVRYFLSIVGIIRFCDFMFFPSRRNMVDISILYSGFQNSGKIISHSWM